MDSAATATARRPAKMLSGILLLVVLLFGTLRADAGSEGLLDKGRGKPVASVGIRGIATGKLAPGRMTPLRIQLRNKTRGSVRVSKVRIRITKVIARRATPQRPCSKADFRIRQIPVRYQKVLKPRQRAWVPTRYRPAIGIVNRRVNQDGCKGAVVRLAFTAYRVKKIKTRR